MKYFVCPIEPTDWRFPFADFIRVLLQRWPYAKVHPPVAEDPGVCFDIPEGEDYFIFGGDLHRDEQTVTFEGDRDQVAEFALWLRSVIPASVPLVFFTESGRVNMWLTPATTKGELVRALMTDRRDLGP